MNIVYPLPFQLSSLQTLASSKNYVSIFPSFISGLSEVGFLKQVYKIFGKTRTSIFFQTDIEVPVKRKQLHFPLSRDIDKKHHALSNILEPQNKTVSILKDNFMKIGYRLVFQLSSLQTFASSKNYVSIITSFISGLSEVVFLKQVYQVFGKTRTSLFFQTTIYVLVKRK